MEILTDTNRDLSKVRVASPEIKNRALDALLCQPEVNTELTAQDRQAQELIEQLLDLFEDG